MPTLTMMKRKIIRQDQEIRKLPLLDSRMPLKRQVRSKLMKKKKRKTTRKMHLNQMKP